MNNILVSSNCLFFKPIPVTAWSTEWVFGRLFDGIAGSHPAGGMDVLSLESLVFCQVEVSGSG